MSAKAWTVMVYLAGDNNLDAAGVTDLGEMKQVGSNGDINLVAQFDRHAANVGTTRYFLRKGGALANDAIAQLGETDTGDPKALENFINWATDNYPARRYLLVLWNHGQGWDDTDIYAGERGRAAGRGGIALVRRGKSVRSPVGPAVATAAVADLNRVGARRLRRAFFATSAHTALRAVAAGGMRARAILLDDNAKDFLDNVEMKAVFLKTRKRLGRKIDLVGMDACLMSMAEVAYQIRDSTQFLVGSEQTEPGDGWPYQRVLAALAARPTMTSAELAQTVVKEYLASYGTNAGVTQSATDLARCAALATAIGALASALKAGVAKPATRGAIMQARGKVQSFDVVDNVDLCDLCNLLKQGVGKNTPIGRACDHVLAAVGGANGIVIAAGSKGADLKHSSGLAIYFPTTSVSPLYARLDFVKKTRWGAFLLAYFAAVRKRGGRG